jgi:rhodanese-related sulfurtransferase
MIIGFIAVVLVLGMLWPFTAVPGQNSAAFESISASDLQQIIMNDSTTFVLDVRTAAEYTGPLGHIAGSTLIPVQELAARIGELKSNADQDIYVICRSGNRSRTASKILISNDYKAINILGGIRAWNKQLATN